MNLCPPTHEAKAFITKCHALASVTLLLLNRDLVVELLGILFLPMQNDAILMCDILDRARRKFRLPP